MCRLITIQSTHNRLSFGVLVDNDLIKTIKVFKMTKVVYLPLGNIKAYFKDEVDFTKDADESHISILNDILRSYDLSYRFKLLFQHIRRTVLTVDLNGHQFGYCDDGCTSIKELFDYVNESIDYYHAL